MLHPPVALAVAQAADSVPGPDERWAYEPRFDGWRAMVFSAAGFVLSRRENELAERFPEVVAAARELGDVVLDGEIVALRGGRLDFASLVSSPATRTAAGVTIYYVAFDLLAVDDEDLLLAVDDEDLRSADYRVRRQRLELVMDGAVPPLQLVPSTRDRDAALTWMQPAMAAVGIEGVVAKRLDRSYRPGRTGDWVKARQMTVVDAVVVGVTGPLETPQELVLARPDESGELRRIGLSLPLPQPLRELAGQRLTATGDRVLISSGVFGRGRVEYQPVHPRLVVEVQAEASVEAFTNRLRPRVHRIRTDLTVEDLRPS